LPKCPNPEFTPSLGIQVTANFLLRLVIVTEMLVMTAVVFFCCCFCFCHMSNLLANIVNNHTGFWDIDKLEDKHQGVRAFKVHNQPINCITFDKFNSTRLLTTSYDGYVRCLDLHSNVFDEVTYLK